MSTPLPLIVGTRRNGRQRYTSTTSPTMRRVAERVTVAVIGLAALLGALMATASGSSIADQCADIYVGTDVAVPADVASICSSAH